MSKERRRAWSQDTAPSSEPTRQFSNQLNTFSRNLIVGILTVPIAILIMAACAVMFPKIVSTATPPHGPVAAKTLPSPPRDLPPSPLMTQVPPQP